MQNPRLPCRSGCEERQCLKCGSCSKWPCWKLAQGHHRLVPGFSGAVLHQTDWSPKVTWKEVLRRTWDRERQYSVQLTMSVLSTGLQCSCWLVYKHHLQLISNNLKGVQIENNTLDLSCFLLLSSRWPSIMEQWMQDAWNTMALSLISFMLWAAYLPSRSLVEEGEIVWTRGRLKIMMGKPTKTASLS